MFALACVQELFNIPLMSMVEGKQELNKQLVSKLHGILRPFILRRLKADVAKQLPAKYGAFVCFVRSVIDFALRNCVLFVCGHLRRCGRVVTSRFAPYLLVRL